jgi:hypothetical protein
MKSSFSFSSNARENPAPGKRGPGIQPNKNPLYFIVLLTSLGAIHSGCQTQYPTNFQPPAANSPSPMVINFEGSGSAVTTVNPNLAEAGTPNGKVYQPGTVGLLPGGSAMTIVSTGTAGVTQSLHVYGEVTGTQLQLTILLDPGSPAVPPNPGGLYNASLFTGVKFYMMVAGDDTTSPKFFSIPIAQTMPTTNLGTCSTGCYDHFGYSYGSTNGQWQLLTLDFSSLKRQGYGSAITPSTLTGTNLEQFVQLQWQENSTGTSNADFWIDEVQFY